MCRPVPHGRIVRGLLSRRCSFAADFLRQHHTTMRSITRRFLTTLLPPHLRRRRRHRHSAPISGDLLYATHRRYNVSSQLTPFLFMHISVGSCASNGDVNCALSTGRGQRATMNCASRRQIGRQTGRQTEREREQNLFLYFFGTICNDRGS